MPLERSTNPILLESRRPPNPLTRGKPQPTVPRKRTLRREETPKRRFARVTREKAAVAQIERLPGEGEEIVMILTGDYHGWDIVAAVIELAATSVSHLRVATLGFNRAQTLHLAGLIDDGQIERLTMIVSEMFREKNKSEFGFLQQEMDDRGQVVRCARNHAKLLCFELADDRRIVTHGSLNLRRCSSYEQIAISSSRGLHDFFAAFIDEVSCSERAD